MKKQIIISCIYLFPVILFAQNIPEEPNLFPRTEVGLNFSQFVNNFINFGNDQNPIQENESLLLLKFGNGEGYFRTGLAFAYNQTEDGFQRTTTQLWGFKFGYEKKMQIGKDWAWSLGGDVVAMWDLSKTESTDIIFGNFSFEDNSSRYGGEGLVGIQWFINDRIALSTESYLLITYNEDVIKQDPGSGGEDKNDGISMQLIPPTSLYFSVYF